MKKPLILVCNSHIDPVWLWEWEEGIAETLSTFRTAVKFCEKYEDFVFCHNESLLYEWTEKYDPLLFERIQSQVEAGRWHIMGGWYVQPDCNLLLGESVVRQIITGKKYFLEKFGKEPRTAINFDSFGHSRGLVQVMAAAGYDSYLFCRPDNKYLNLPGDTFQWLGFDGSIVMAHRADDHYNSSFGQAGKKVRDWMNNPGNKAKERGVILWGIGNHGGGPSEKDIEEIRKIRNEEISWDITHGTPEEYFSQFSKKPETFPVFKGDLNPFAIGCYTSMKTVKQALYRLEHKYYTAEKLLSLSSFSGNIEYPGVKLEEALKELLFCQFHDILPGTSVEPVELDVLNRLGHATKIIENETASLYIKTGNTLKPAAQGEFPLMLINPHPFDTNEIVEMELQLAEPNFEKTKRLIPLVFNENGEPISVQSEKTQCNIKNDHRKKIVFRAKIPAGEVRRYSCLLKDFPGKEFTIPVRKDLSFSTAGSKLVIDKKSGFPVSWEYEGNQLLGTGSFRFAVINDNADPWGMGMKFFDGAGEYFKQMTISEASAFAGLTGKKLDPVYISEDGEIRAIVESLFIYNNSTIHLKYLIPTGQSGFDVEITVYWMEKDKLLKWIIPVGFNMNCIGRSVSGINCFKHREREFVMRDWLGMKNFEGENSFSVCSDGAYGFDIKGNSVGLSLLRSPSYSGHPVEGEKDIVLTDRVVKRIDQGVHTFRFRFIPGNTDDIIDKSFNQSDLFNNPVISRVIYPTGEEKNIYSGIKISDDSINLQAVKFHTSGSLVIRLLNPCKVTR
ncbi:MAG: alpha-mannosidase, partial [Odoribacter sp.]|nr:alpha-mannosidase [Odoribacter sp.]